MENWIVGIAVPIVIALLVNGAALLLWKSQRKRNEAASGKDRADAADVLTDASLKIVKRMEDRVEELEEQLDCQQLQITEQSKEIRNLNKRVVALENEKADLLRGFEMVVGQIVSLGHEPVRRPVDG